MTLTLARILFDIGYHFKKMDLCVEDGHTVKKRWFRKSIISIKYKRIGYLESKTKEVVTTNTIYVFDKEHAEKIEKEINTYKFDIKVILHVQD